MTLIDAAVLSGARREEACQLLGMSLRTFKRWKKGGHKDKRKSAIRSVSNKLTNEERKEMLTIATSEKYRDLSPSKIVPALADEGIYIASESSFYRLLRESNHLAHRQRSKQPCNNHPAPCTASAPNQVWSWDISYLPTQVAGAYFFLYMIVDIFSRKIVGWSVHAAESAEHAANLIKESCDNEQIKEDQLYLHSDNGSPMKGVTMLLMLQQLGVMPSFSRPSVSNDNPYSEALFRTVKYHPTFPAWSKFETIEDARAWCIKFVEWYNHEHLHSGIKFITPQQRHTGEDATIMSNRDAVYQQAKAKNPQRWSGNTRNWELPSSVTLNPKHHMSSKNNHEMGVKMAV
jgi:putative transposase